MTNQFNAAEFTMPSATQQLKTELVCNVPEFTFGLYAEDGRPAKEKTTIAFGVMENGVKRRLGSVVINEDYILVLPMDCEKEFRGKDTWDTIYFLRKLAASDGYSWEEAEFGKENKGILY